MQGETSPEETADLARGKLRPKIPQLVEALEGRVNEHHRFLMQMQMEHLEYLEKAIAHLHERIDEKIKPYQHEVDLICTTPGIDTIAAQHIFAEIGGDISVIPSEGHLASWVGICPGNNESAGKRRSGRTTRGNRWLKAL